MPQPDHIMRLDLPSADSFDDATKKYFDICQEKLGLVPYVLQSFAIDPEKLQTFSSFYNKLMLAPCGISKLEREMIATVVSSANRCYYCLVAHGQTVRQLSGDPQLGEMMVMNYRVADLDDRQQAMLDFAWKLTKDPQTIGEADRQSLRDVGFSDKDIFDIADVASFFNYTNRMAHATDMMPNPEYHAMSR